MGSVNSVSKPIPKKNKEQNQYPTKQGQGTSTKQLHYSSQQKMK